MNWNDLDSLAAFQKLSKLKGHVNLQEAMSGENGADRVRKYQAAMAAGLTYTHLHVSAVLIVLYGVAAHIGDYLVKNGTAAAVDYMLSGQQTGHRSFFSHGTQPPQYLSGKLIEVNVLLIGYTLLVQL